MVNKRIKLFFLFFLTFHNVLCFANPDQSFILWLNEGMKTHHIPGISIAVIKHYQLEWAEGFGMADLENKKLMTKDNLFQAGSISKPITAIAALRAVQEGKLTLDENVNSYLTSWKIPENHYTKKIKVTLRYLLSHSAGINVPGFLGYTHGKPTPTLFELLDGKPPANSQAIRVFEPIGEQFDYSGGGYIVVQQILMNIYKQPFAQLMDQLVLKPLNMTSSTFLQPLPAKLMPNIAVPYRPDGMPVPGGPHTYIAGAAAGLWSTPSDLAQVVLTIQKSLKGQSDQLLTPQMARLLALKPQSKAPNIQMGLGMLVRMTKEGTSAKNGRYFSHAGQNEGYRNLLIGSIENGNGLVIMTNMSPAEDTPSDKGWVFINDIKQKLIEMEQFEP